MRRVGSEDRISASPTRTFRVYLKVRVYLGFRVYSSVSRVLSRVRVYLGSGGYLGLRVDGCGFGG